MSRSFHNKILCVNLSTRTVAVEEPGEAYLRRYMGGWNLIADVLLKRVPAGADPLGPDNVLVYAPGVLTGLAISGASRSAVGAKSPVTGGFGAAEAGGAFRPTDAPGSMHDRRARRTPVYLWIADGACEIATLPPSGAGPRETEAPSRRGRPGAGGLAMIGPGGENMVQYACVMHGLRTPPARTGLGAVMELQRLKAVRRSAAGVDGADADTVRAMARRGGAGGARGHPRGLGGARGCRRRGARGRASSRMPIRNFRDGEVPEISGLSTS